MSGGGHPSDFDARAPGGGVSAGQRWSGRHHGSGGELRSGSPGGEPRAADLSAWVGPRHPARARGGLPTGHIMGLDRARMGHAISLAVVPNVALGQTRVGE